MQNVCIPLLDISIRYSQETCLTLLTRWTKVLSFARRPELLLHGLFEARLREPRRAPDLQPDMLLVVDPVLEEHGGQVHIGEVTAVERSQAVLGEMLDPLRAGAIVLLRIVRGLCRVMRVTVVGRMRHRRRVL